MATGHAGTRQQGTPDPSANGHWTAGRDGAADIVVRIRSLLPNLAPAEQRVARLAIENPGETARWTISEFADRAETSGTTIIRFCRAIGLDGYPALRIALAAAAGHDAAGAWRSVSGDIGPDDSLGDVVQKIGHADARAVEETIAQLDLQMLDDVANALIAARRIDVYGIGASGLVALDLQQKLHRLGKIIYAWTEAQMALTSAAMLGPEDVVIGISYSGANVDTIDPMRLGKANGAIAVALTNHPRSPLAALADYVFMTAAMETMFRSGAMPSRIAQLTVVDCLFAVIAQRNFTDALEALGRTHAAVGRRRDMLA
ncbi:MAG: MurR/RpiR family transcriptional regulator [Streptosporangiaceae bacterium]